MWQPIPAPTTLPSGTMRDLLCGHPEQKYGVRLTLSGIKVRFADDGSLIGASMDRTSNRARRRWPTTRR